MPPSRRGPGPPRWRWPADATWSGAVPTAASSMFMCRWWWRAAGPHQCWLPACRCRGWRRWRPGRPRGSQAGPQRVNGPAGPRRGDQEGPGELHGGRGPQRDPVKGLVVAEVVDRDQRSGAGRQCPGAPVPPQPGTPGGDQHDGGDEQPQVTTPAGPTAGKRRVVSAAPHCSPTMPPMTRPGAGSTPTPGQPMPPPCREGRHLR
jgi:hypothetical protein